MALTTNRKGSILSETTLHLELKNWYARPDDQIEAPLGDYFIDIRRGDLLIEIQTANFNAIKPKLLDLLPDHALRLIYPVAAERWILRLPQSAGEKPSRRKSPKRGSYLDLFNELVSFPELIHHPNLSIEVLLIQEEEIRQHKPGRRWRRRGWATTERRLLAVVGQRVFHGPQDFRALLPAQLPGEFTTADLARVLQAPRSLAQKVAYCLRGMQVIQPIGKQGRANLYSW